MSGIATCATGKLMGDIYDIAVRVKEFDPDLHITWNARKECYQIHRESRGKMFFVGDVPPGKLNNHVIRSLRASDMRRNRIYDTMTHLERKEQKEEELRDARFSDDVQAIARDNIMEMAGEHLYNLGSIGGN